MAKSADPAKRRVFLKLKDGSQAFQIFSVAQERDGSIYISSPNFAESKWLDLSRNIAALGARATSSPGLGKLSIHASGLAGVRAHDSSGHRYRVQGIGLADTATNTQSVRHLCTVFISEPNHMPPSPAGNRISDYVLHGPRFRPMAFIFFAVPRGGGLRGIKGECAFHVDVMDTPPDWSFGEITLPMHSLVWFAYSTKQMTSWPPSFVYCHNDGFIVPFFMGGGPVKWTFCAVNPLYEISSTSELTIKLDVSAFDATQALPS
jgi:hypothetical protein